MPVGCWLRGPVSPGRGGRATRTAANGSEAPAKATRSRGRGQRQADPGNERSALVTERGLPSRLCLLRQISFKLKTQPTPPKRKQNNPLPQERRSLVRAGPAAGTCPPPRAPARARPPRQPSGPLPRRGAGPDPRGRQSRPNPGRGAQGRAWGGRPRRGASSEGSQGGQGARRTQASLRTRQARNAHPPHGNKTSASRGREGAPPRRAPRAPGPAEPGSGRGGPAPPRSGPSPEEGAGWALRCPGRWGGRRGAGGARRRRPDTPAPPTRTRPDWAASTPPPPPNVRLQLRGDGAVERAQSPRACEPRRY